MSPCNLPYRVCTIRVPSRAFLYKSNVEHVANLITTNWNNKIEPHNIFIAVNTIFMNCFFFLFSCVFLTHSFRSIFIEFYLLRFYLFSLIFFCFVFLINLYALLFYAFELYWWVWSMLFMAKTNQTWKPKNDFIECEIHSICSTECDNKYSTDVSNKVEPTLKFIYVIQRNNSISHYNYLHLHVSLHRVLRFTVLFSLSSFVSLFIWFL